LTDPGLIERAIAALRAGRPVRIEGDPDVDVVAVETATAALLDWVDEARSAPLLLSGERAAALSLGNARDAADPNRPGLIKRIPWLDAGTARDLVDPGRDFARAPIGPLQPMPIDAPIPMAAALALATSAGLLPAFWIVDPDHAVTAVPAEALANKQSQVELLARARLPLEGLPDTQTAAFRDLADGQEHVALIIGAFAGLPPLVRLHSECLTGDVFGSLKCDCGPQLKEALRIIGDAGGGLLLYLRQEGRGIGLANKVRAYALQDRGLDTVDANRRLGFADDERNYSQAAAILRALGVTAVRLLTNNPAKASGLEAAGIAVVERVAHHMPANPHNADYLGTKRRRSGHLP
jgi:GTP cyclohydrolase II